ncbi:oxidoreductase, FAD/FMN-binding protein [Oesophagostomum dentatum]|uniref:Oxidoreductase, FAD/FMN-binding protein n=1 Tax=Oesophagostomum dentatum TaxID=61180 RepID=A0A0B1SRW8_OESDE|nr:oxidoreductase, FAD/FMN-binding protein [Oesophagostomum dentatum]
MVDPRHLESAGNPIMCKENDSSLLRRAFSALARVSKKDGALVIVQLSHAGRQTPISVNDHPFSCSDVPLESCMIKAGEPIPLGLDQIKAEVIDRFVYAAKMARDTGFDGAQIHAAHGYLLSQFLSLTTNKRTDEYGGSLENRFRIIREIFEAIREEIPAKTGFVVGIKANSVEFQKDGLSTEDAKEACAMMEECGFDFVELSGGNLAKPAWCHERESSKKREAYFIELAEKMGQMSKRPLSELQSVCDDIADLSNPEEVKNFLKFIAVITREIEKMNSERKPVFGRISYSNLY